MGAGALYACACTREEIDERTRQRAEAGDPTPGYDGFCRDRGLPRGEGRALRFRTPDEGVVRVRTSCAATWSSRSGRWRTSSA